MTRLLIDDLEAEAIALEGDARRIDKELKDANLPESHYRDAHRAMVEPRSLAANALRNAKRALELIPPPRHT